VSLLTRVPTRAGSDTGRAVAWFPVVGALLGLAAAGIYAGLRAPTTPAVAASVALGAGLLLTGALHEDGLADVADGFGARLGRERTLEVMADPHHGTYGVAAVVVSIVARVAAISALGPAAALAAVPAAQAMSRAAAGSMMRLFPAARSGGLAASYSGGIARGRVAAGAIVAAVIGAGLLGPWALAAAALAAAAALGMGILSVRTIGGISGDVLGAAQQVAEIAILVLAVAARRSLPWWS
jgi:adenosylcobinamide-GDP ribazoletransferase